MAKPFMDEHFLLDTFTAQKLYHEFAAPQPILDYHCHLPPAEIAGDRRFSNMAELWLGGDHYKWRFMRSAGVPEAFITGDAPDEDRFRRFCEVLPMGAGNPLYHWSHLELRRYFGREELIGADTATVLWEACNARIAEAGFSARALMLRAKVQAACTTDDPTDDLTHHQAIAASDFGVKVLPTFRPDKAFKIEAPGFVGWLARLGEVAGVNIRHFSDVCAALSARLDHFAAQGCRLSDHGIDGGTFFKRAPEAEIDAILGRALAGEALTKRHVEQYKTAVMLFLGREYARRGWAMQLHIGAQRNNNTRMLAALGPDSGFDSMADASIAAKLARLLDALDQEGCLPRTILYCANPVHNEVLATMIGNFQGEGVRGKMQFGAGWWFNDQQDGMLRQLTALAQMGNLGAFVGMLTDSRSFLSYTRHEYFRRILCRLVGGWVENGEYPQDWHLLRRLIEDICYGNAERYFALD